MAQKIGDIQGEAKKIAEQVTDVYQHHTGDDFIGLILHGSAIKGGFIPGSSDIDFQLFLKKTAFDKEGMLPLEKYLKIHKDLSDIDIRPFSYIQCTALTENLAEGFVGPVSGAYKILAGRLPVKEATNEQLKQSAVKYLQNITAVPEYFSSLLDHGKERLTRIVRLLSTKVSPTIYNVISITHQNAVEIWQLPKNEAIYLLPEEEMRTYATNYYKYAKRYYPDENSVVDALEMIFNGSKFFESVKVWIERIDTMIKG